jgi:hypothetical protein
MQSATWPDAPMGGKIDDNNSAAMIRSGDPRA